MVVAFARRRQKLRRVYPALVPQFDIETTAQGLGVGQFLDAREIQRLSAFELRLSERQFRVALRAAERAIYDVVDPVREAPQLRDLAVQAAVEAGANWKVAVAACDRIALYALERRAQDPLSSRVLQGRLARMAQVIAWRREHAAEDARLYQDWKALGSLRRLAEREGVTLKVVRGAVDRERRRRADAALGLRPRSFKEWRREYLARLGLLPTYVQKLPQRFRERVSWEKPSPGRTPVSRK